MRGGYEVKIAILGGGAAGISSAIALKQKGFDVSIYERNETATNIGAGIVVWPNAAYVLEQLGMLNMVKAVSGYPSKMHRLTSANESLGTLDIELINKHMGFPSLSILRSGFHEILISKLESLGVSILYGHKAINIETNNNNQVEVHFETGLKITADVLVGADGRMASVARRYVYGGNKPVYQNFINWIGVFESAHDFFEEIAVLDYWGVGERFGIVPINKRKAYWAGGIACSAIGLKNPKEYKHELAAVFSHWPQPVQRMIQHTPIERINKIYVHDHNPISTWHKHNLIVIGDAAHAALPTSGQGVCQALEDAWHLANCLEENPGDLPRALVKFTEIRFEKTAGIIRAARGFAAMLFNCDEKFCSARNTNSRSTDYAKVAAAMANGWGQHLPLNA